MIEMRPYNVNVDIYSNDDAIPALTLVNELKKIFDTKICAQSDGRNHSEIVFQVTVEDRNAEVYHPLKKLIKKLRLSDEEIEIEIY